ncbi:MAG: Na/Pi cotransporter family protein [Anaerovoracaceae bacterium]
MSNTFIIITSILGGFGLLMYGIEIMKDSLEWVSRGSGQRILEMMGKSTLKGIVSGITVTVINQKSSATTGMVVGMVSGGMITLIQATGVIMGANIGTTVTGQILAFRLELLAPCFVAIGAITWRVSNTKYTENTGKIILGLGIIFIGMIFMEKGFALLYKNEGVRNAILSYHSHSIGRYLLLCLIAFSLTALVHSSSLFHGLMIAMSAQGLMPLELAIPMVLGLNVGKCIPTIINSRGRTRTARQAALIHLLLNLLGAIIVIVFFRNMVSSAMEWISPGNLPRQIANWHTLFNVGTTILCLPLIPLFVWASEKLIRPTKDEPGKEDALDVRMLDAPGLAMAQAFAGITKMMSMALERFRLGFRPLIHEGETGKIADTLMAQEENILQYQKEIEVYLVKLGQRNITKEQKHKINLMFSVMGDIERISDICNNFISLNNYKRKNKVLFSEEAINDLKDLHDRIYNAGTDIIGAMKQNDPEMVRKALEKEKGIRDIEEGMRQSHIERLNLGHCSPGSGVLFLDYAGTMERVAEHIRKTGYFVIELSAK